MKSMVWTIKYLIVKVLVNVVEFMTYKDRRPVSPPGDLRQVLCALSQDDEIAKVMSYRFLEGPFKGHPLGNIVLEACEMSSGDLQKGLEIAHRIFRVK